MDITQDDVQIKIIKQDGANRHMIAKKCDVEIEVSEFGKNNMDTFCRTVKTT